MNSPLHTVPLFNAAEVSQGLNVSGARGAGRLGGWELGAVESGDIQDDRLQLDSVKTISVERNVRNERHLLKPYDLLVTARSREVKAAIVPTQVSRTVAGATLLVVRPREPELGLYLWYYMTSAFGRSQVQAQVTAGATISSLSAKALGEVVVPVPPLNELRRIAALVEASEQAYAAGQRALHLRRDIIRDSIIDTLRMGAK